MQTANRENEESKRNRPLRGAPNLRRQMEFRIERMLGSLEEQRRRQEAARDGRVEIITRTLQSLHELLAPERWFQEQLQCARAGAGDNPEWVTLYQGQGARFGLIAISEGAPVPLHDHPDTVGVMLLLNGRLLVLKCKLSGRVNARGASLQVVSRRRIDPAQTAAVTPAGGDIHHLRSLDGCSVAIDLLVEGRDSIPRNWYFPLGRRRAWEAGDRFSATVLTDWRGLL